TPVGIQMAKTRSPSGPCTFRNTSEPGWGTISLSEKPPSGTESPSPGLGLVRSAKLAPSPARSRVPSQMISTPEATKPGREKLNPRPIGSATRTNPPGEPPTDGPAAAGRGVLVGFGEGASVGPGVGVGIVAAPATRLTG